MRSTHKDVPARMICGLVILDRFFCVEAVSLKSTKKPEIPQIEMIAVGRGGVPGRDGCGNGESECVVSSALLTVPIWCRNGLPMPLDLSIAF